MGFYSVIRPSPRRLGITRNVERLCDLRLESDVGRGERTPGATVRWAAEAGCQVVALADWQSGAGLADATEAALGAGVALLPAVSVGVHGTDGPLEIVAYGCDTAPIPSANPSRVALADGVTAIQAAGGVAVLTRPASGVDALGLERRLVAA